MPHSNAIAAPLLTDNLALLTSLKMHAGVLDLACGRGRNGLMLAACKLPVTFVDRDKDALGHVAAALAAADLAGECRLLDLEAEHSKPLAGMKFDAALVFNYLHRPLFKALGKVIRPGGLIFYETFTLAQRQFGRPSSAAFLLRPNELCERFSGWEVLHYFEGELAAPDRAIASLIARRP
jgi:SAM-dependent methyltransferase